MTTAAALPILMILAVQTKLKRMFIKSRVLRNTLSDYSNDDHEDGNVE